MYLLFKKSLIVLFNLSKQFESAKKEEEVVSGTGIAPRFFN